MSFIKYNCNTCDQIENEVMVHYTKRCENRCPFCIDKLNAGVNCKEPRHTDILFTILENKDKIDSVTFTGGEPLLYMKNIHNIISDLKLMTKLKINIITSVPYACFRNKDLFYEILRIVDSLCISVQHHDEKVADDIRRVKSRFDHQEFYRELIEHCQKTGQINKLSININVCKPYFKTKEDVLECISHYNKMGFKNIRICEMFDKDSMFINIEKLLGIKLGRPFATGCSTKNYDISDMLPDFDGNLTIKRVCFYRTKHRHASIADLIKICTRWLFSKKYFFGVIHENGELYPHWV